MTSSNDRTLSGVILPATERQDPLPAAPPEPQSEPPSEAGSLRRALLHFLAFAAFFGVLVLGAKVALHLP